MDKNAIVVAGPEGRIRFWSLGAETTFGHSAGEAIGQTLDLIVPPEHREAHWTGFKRAIASGAAQAEGGSSAFPVWLASGEIEIRQATLSLIREPAGQVIGAMVVFAEHPAV